MLQKCKPKDPGVPCKSGPEVLILKDAIGGVFTVLRPGSE